MYEITQYVRNNTTYQSTGKKGIRIEKKTSYLEVPINGRCIL